MSKSIEIWSKSSSDVVRDVKTNKASQTHLIILKPLLEPLRNVKIDWILVVKDAKTDLRRSNCQQNLLKISKINAVLCTFKMSLQAEWWADRHPYNTSSLSKWYNFICTCINRIKVKLIELTFSMHIFFSFLTTFIITSFDWIDFNSFSLSSINLIIKYHVTKLLYHFEPLHR